MTPDQWAEVIGLASGLVLAIPAVRLLRLQRRISRLSPIADNGKSKEGRQLATDLRQQYKEGMFGFSWFDATCVALGLLLLVVSVVMKL